jgi:hypothetical protein
MASFDDDMIFSLRLSAGTISADVFSFLVATKEPGGISGTIEAGSNYSNGPASLLTEDRLAASSVYPPVAGGAASSFKTRRNA